MGSPGATQARDATAGPWLVGVVGAVVVGLIIGLLEVSLWLVIVTAVPVTVLIVALITVVRGRARRGTR